MKCEVACTDNPGTLKMVTTQLWSLNLKLGSVTDILSLRALPPLVGVWGESRIPLTLRWGWQSLPKVTALSRLGCDEGPGITAGGGWSRFAPCVEVDFVVG